MNQNATIITSEKNWLESSAISQLNAITKLDGVTRVVGLPDLHAGKSPVGMVFTTEDIIYPHLIGNDIGCGMGLFATGIALDKFVEKRWVSRLNHIRELGDVEAENPYDEESPIRDLGTIGDGNHFAEFQKVEEVMDADAFNMLGLPQNEVVLLIHSGSRGYGQRIFKELNFEIGLTGDKADDYLANHDNALKWAERNRAVTAKKLTNWLGFGSEPTPLIDLPHNYIKKHDGLYIHRKVRYHRNLGLSYYPVHAAA